MPSFDTKYGRNMALDGNSVCPKLLDEACDEIDRLLTINAAVANENISLRQQIAEANEKVQLWKDTYAKQGQEVAALKAQGKRMRETVSRVVNSCGASPSLDCTKQTHRAWAYWVREELKKSLSSPDTEAHQPEPCKWWYDDGDDMWSGSCGIAWCIPEGDVRENGIHYCPKCGRKVEVKAEEAHPEGCCDENPCPKCRDGKCQK